MSRINETYNCDICGKQFLGREAVRNQVDVYNGKHEGNYYFVCQKCVDKIGDVIDELKPVKKESSGIHFSGDKERQYR